MPLPFHRPADRRPNCGQCVAWRPADTDAVLEHLRAPDSPLAKLREPTLRRLALGATQRTLLPGECVCPKGYACNGVLQVLEGDLRAQVCIRHPDKAASPFAIHPGELFGLPGAFDRVASPIPFVAERRSVVLRIDGPTLHEAIARDGRLALVLMDMLSAEHERLARCAANLSLPTCDARIARYLVGLLDDIEPTQAPIVVLPEKKQSIATRLSITPESLSRSFRQLIDRKLVRLRQRRIEVLDEPELRKLAGLPPSGRPQAIPQHGVATTARAPVIALRRDLRPHPSRPCPN